MNRHHFFNHARGTALLVVVTTLVITVARTDAAYRITRPIAIDANYGYINQLYLYGEPLPGNPNVTHLGVDFPAPLDRSVYAVADRVVRDVMASHVARLPQPKMTSLIVI